MGIPLFSTVTLGTELVVTAAVLYVFYRGWTSGIFPRVVAGLAIGYEILFNITYMLSRVLMHENPSTRESGPALMLAAFHGIFSLVMFIALLVFVSVAWWRYAHGENYFKAHPRLTVSFIILWLVAVCSGFLFYYVTYLA